MYLSPKIIGSTFIRGLLNTRRQKAPRGRAAWQNRRHTKAHQPAWGGRPEHINLVKPDSGDCTDVADVIQYLRADRTDYAEVGDLDLVTKRQNASTGLEVVQRAGLAFPNDQLQFIAAEGITNRKRETATRKNNNELKDGSVTPDFSKPLNLAVVGAGDMGRRQMLAIETEIRCELSAIVDPSPHAGPLADSFGVPLFSDLESMHDRVRPDAVVIATPNALHVPLALQCIDRHIPVLVEKPIADTVRDAHVLADRSESTGVPVLVGHHRRHNPIIQRARELVQSGQLGKITGISATWLVCKPDGYYAMKWRRERGGGPILINLIHDVDSLRFLVGEVTAVQAIVANARRGFDVEDSAVLLLRFENGALGTIIVSDATPAPWSWELTSGETTSYRYPQTGEDCYRLAGTRGSLGLPTMRFWHYPEEQGWNEPLIEERIPVAPEDPLALQLRHFLNVVKETEKPLVNARDAAQTLAVTLAVSEAARQGVEISL